jgi:NAD(P)-dependent dehydrogenase (short-subunit alcohol dehydrogenase family)
MGRVAGKVALVAGAGGGIGGAGAEALAREDAAVLCTDSDAAGACLELRARYAPASEAIDSVVVRGHPLMR